MHTNIQTKWYKPQKCVKTHNVGGCSDTTAWLKWRKQECLDLINVYLFEWVWVILLSIRPSLFESLAPNIKFCRVEWFSDFSFKTRSHFLVCLTARPSVFLCECMHVLFRVHVENGTRFITISPPWAISSIGTPEHIHWMQMHKLRQSDAPTDVAVCVCVC